MDPIVSLALQIVFAAVDQAAKHVPALIAALESSNLTPEQRAEVRAKLRDKLKATEELVAAARFLAD